MLTRMTEPGPASSPLAEALGRVGDRWTLLIVEALLSGPRRFNDLLGQIPGLAANILLCHIYECKVHKFRYLSP